MPIILKYTPSAPIQSLFVLLTFFEVDIATVKDFF